MADTDFDDSFVTVVNTNGEKQRIPARWLDHAVLGEGFRPAPSQAAQLATEGGTTGRAEIPDTTWNVSALKAHAVKHDIDLGDATTKADILAVLTTQTPDPTPGPDETPADGDEKEN